MGASLLEEEPGQSLTPGRHADTQAADDEVPAATETLVRRLVRHVVKSASRELLNLHPEGEPHSGFDTILDMEVDGVRCLLVRLPVGPARAQSILSPREQEIARMVAEGYPNKTIAAVLDISIWTVCTHLRRVFAKLGVGSRAAMVARLLEDGLLGQTFRAPDPRDI